MHNLVPEFIVENYAAGNYRGGFRAASMFVDISGFTAITDTLMTHGPHGAEVLATLMRRVLDPLIHGVYAHGGMIVNFAGDAFTALFDLVEGAGGVLGALAAAWQLQGAMAASADQSTVYGDFRFSAKVGLALGEVRWGVVTAEDGRRAAYYFQGSAVSDCAVAEHFARAGEIVLDAALYDRVRGYVAAEPLEDHFRLIEVIRELPAARPVENQVPTLEIQGRFYPPGLLTQTSSGEFRQVVNLFIGLPTVRTEAQLAIFMQSLFELQDKYGGLLNRLDFGDKGSHLLLFWGAPVAYENDVQRALNFILALQARTSIPINAGVTYQIAHAGFIGSSLREDFTCYGSGVNLAARFMSAAQRGEIWLDEAAARSASGHFEIEYLGVRSFKGFEEQQPVYVLYDRKEAAESFFEGALVGREEQLAQLAAFIEPLWQGKFAGALVVWGEAGIGKSRLAVELRTKLLSQGKEALWAVCRADEISRQSLGAWRYWLRKAFEQSEALIEARNKRSFNRRLDELIASTRLIDQALAEELDRTGSFLAALLDLHWPDSLYEQLDAQGRYENTMIALATLVRAESLHHPVVIVLEDAQWLDVDTLQFLPQLMRTLTADETKSYPVAVIANSRREGMADQLMDTTSFKEIDLDSLPHNQVARLAQAFLKAPTAPGLLNFLMARTQGNPFFVEQVLGYLQEAALLEQSEAGWQVRTAMSLNLIPTDVRAVLVARLDRLAHEVKDVVQTAAVIGQEFEFRLLARMLKADESLSQKVAAAERAAIWLALSDLRYLFKSALLRDAAYSMQVRARRQELHALAAECLEDLYAPDMKPHYAELAFHAERSGHQDKARDYYRLAGDVSRDEFQNNRAVDYYSRALDLTPEGDLKAGYLLRMAREGVYDLLGAWELQEEDLLALDRLVEKMAQESGSTENAVREAELTARWASYFINLGRYAEAAATAEEAISLATPGAAPEIGVTGFRILALALFRQGKHDQAAEKALSALNLARTVADRRGESRLLNLLGLIALEKRNTLRARGYFEQSCQIVQELEDRREQARPLNNLGNAMASEGNFEGASGYYERALQIVREIGDRTGEGLVLGNLGWIAKMEGDYAAAQTHTEQARRIAREVGNRHQEAFAMINLSWLLTAQGDISRALSYAEQSLDLNRETGDRSGEAWSLTCLGHVRFELQQFEEAQQAYQSALKIRHELDQPNLATEPLAGLAQVALAMGELDSAKTYLQPIQAHLDNGGNLEGTEEPLRVYLIAYRVLQAIQDQQAGSILETAYRQLQEQAGKIKDRALRNKFLEEVTCNRAIIAAWEASRGAAPA